jgi:hypothetical protein
VLIEVLWSELDDDADPLWSGQYCLYAYLHARRDWLLYLGKANFASVRNRLGGAKKAQLFADIDLRYGTDGVRVLHGKLLLERGSRLTSELLADVESLLVLRLAPFGNTQSLKSDSRSGLRVHCVGDWPFNRFRFRGAG